MRTISLVVLLILSFVLFYLIQNDNHFFDIYKQDKRMDAHNGEEKKQPVVQSSNSEVFEQESTDHVKLFLEDLEKNNIPLLITSGVNSTLYVGNQSSGVVQATSFAGVDMYTYVLEETDYRAPVAVRGKAYNQFDIYEIMKEKGIVAASGCMLDQDGFEVPTAEYQKQLDEYWERLEESKKLGEEFIDDGSVDVFRCANKNVFCTPQGCGWVFSIKTGGGGHGFVVRQESLVVH